MALLSPRCLLDIPTERYANIIRNYIVCKIGLNLFGDTTVWPRIKTLVVIKENVQNLTESPLWTSPDGLCLAAHPRCLVFILNRRSRVPL